MESSFINMKLIQIQVSATPNFFKYKYENYLELEDGNEQSSESHN